MEIQASYAAMSDVPTGYESAYTETDGNAVFTGGDFRTEAEYNTVHAAKKTAFDDYHKANNELKAFEGLDVAKYKSNQEELDVFRARAKEGGTDEEVIGKIVQDRLARLTEELTNENGDLKTQLGELTGFKLKTEKTGILNEVLGKHVSSEARADAKIIIGLAIEKQADGTWMSNGTQGFEKGLSVEKLVEKALESRSLWKKKNTPGHGAGGSGGAGNLTERAQFDKLLAKGASRNRAENKQLEQLADKMKAEQT